MDASFFLLTSRTRDFSQRDKKLAELNYYGKQNINLRESSRNRPALPDSTSVRVIRGILCNLNQVAERFVARGDPPENLTSHWLYHGNPRSRFILYD